MKKRKITHTKGYHDSPIKRDKDKTVEIIEEKVNGYSIEAEVCTSPGVW